MSTEYRFEVSSTANNQTVNVRRFIDHNEATYAAGLPHSITLTSNVETAPAAMFVFAASGQVYPGLKVEIYDIDDNLIADSTEYQSSNGYAQVAYGIPKFQINSVYPLHN